jgi:transcriptional regulator with XRE-family HTH domain
MVASIAWEGPLMADAEGFGARLRELREKAGLTQEDLAERAGVKRGAVARWESGAREPSWGNIVALADALGVSTEAFREEPDEPPEKRKAGRPKKPTSGEPAPETPAADEVVQAEKKPKKRGKR